MKKLSILGSTGSIGVNTLDVVASHPSEFAITALAAGRNIALLKTQIERFRPRLVAVFDEEHAAELRRLLGPDSGTAVFSGPEGYREAAAAAGTDMVVSAWSARPVSFPPWRRSKRAMPSPWPTRRRW